MFYSNRCHNLGDRYPNGATYILLRLYYYIMREIQFLKTVETVLKNRRQLFANIHDNRELRQYFIDFQIAIAIFSLFYGASMGLYSGGIQTVYSAIKIPMLLFITLYICVPTFFILDSLVGGAISLRQMVTLLLAGFTILVSILIAFLPVTLFFLLTTSDYAFIVFLNVAVFGLGGIGALMYFLQGYNTIYNLEKEPGPRITETGNCPTCDQPISPDQAFCPSCGTRFMRTPESALQTSSMPILIGCLTLIFVGTQLSWILRPYFHYYPWFIRPLGGNFYSSLFRLLRRILFIY